MFSSERRSLKKSLSHVNKMPVYSDMPSNYTINYAGAKSAITRTSNNEKMLTKLVERTKLELCVTAAATEAAV
jgi:hypothetical protein